MFENPTRSLEALAVFYSLQYLLLPYYLPKMKRSIIFKFYTYKKVKIVDTTILKIEKMF